MELAIFFGFCALLGALSVFVREILFGPKRPKKIKQRKEKPRKFATPPTARVAEINPQPVTERGMNEDLQRFVAKGFLAIQDEQNTS